MRPKRREKQGQGFGIFFPFLAPVRGLTGLLYREVALGSGHCSLLSPFMPKSEGVAAVSHYYQSWGLDHLSLVPLTLCTQFNSLLLPLQSMPSISC